MKRLIVLLQALIISISVFSIDPSRIKFEYLTVDDGLSQGIIQDIFQDSRGFIWIATRDGLNRYDGLGFVIFRNNRKDTNSLASNFVYCIQEDSLGNLWIGSNGLNRYNPETGEMTRIAVDAKNANSFHGGWVYDIAIDNDNTIWLATSNGLAHFNPADKSFKTYANNPANPKSIGAGPVYSIKITNDNRLFVSPDTDPIYEFNRKSGDFSAINYKLNYYGENVLKCIQSDPNGLLYINSENDGVHIYDPLTNTSKLIENKEGSLNTNTVRSRVLIVSDEEIWMGTDGGGINIYNPKTEAFNYLTLDTKISNSLNGNAVYKIMQDKDKNIWIGHFGNGISIWKKNKEKFISYKHNPFSTASINKEIVCAIYEDSKGRVWIGQDGGGLSLFDEGNQSFEHFRHKNGDPTSPGTDVILSINEDPSGNLLLGTYAGGMMVFDPESRKVIKTYSITDGMSSNNIWLISKDLHERYWLLTLRGGVNLFDPLTGSFRIYTPDNNNSLMCSSDLMTMTEDKDGNLWFGTDDNGICILDANGEKTVKSYTYDEKNLNSLSNNSIKSIVFLNNFAWIATNGGGLNRLNLKTDSFKVFTMSEGLSSNALMGILKDTENNLWISSTRGLMKFNPNTEKVTIFDKSQGIQGYEFKYNAQCILSDGRMMFGGVNGLTVFNPLVIRNSLIKPDVVLTGFRIYNETIMPGKKGSPLSKAIDYTSRIKLKHNQLVFTFEFASLDYNSPENNKFLYKMEGFDKDWIDAGNKNYVTYTNLGAGKYTFLLKGSNSDGVWNETPREIQIRIRPPWYKTKLAWLLFLVIFIVLLRLGYMKLREKQTVIDNQLLQQKIDEAQSELDGKVLELDKQKEELKRRDEEERDIRFFTEGVAKFSDIIAKKRRNLEELATGLVSELVEYVNASAGEVYIENDSDPQHILLRVIGECNYSSDRERRLDFEVGEGYIGTCFIEKQSLKVDDLPDNYIVLRSGLGKFSLPHALFVPLLHDKKCVGVFEIASLEKLPDNKVAFIEKIAESFASVITIVKANEKSNEMLEQNNAQAEELKAQEEEMRQNMEELIATQEESQRKEKQIIEELVSKTALVQKLQEELSTLKNKKRS